MLRPSRVVSAGAIALMMLVPCLCWSAAEIGSVVASKNKDAVVVEIQITGNPSRTLFSELSGPSRLVINFHGATPSGGFQKIVLGQGPVLAARTALFGTDREGEPVTRVVLDLGGPIRYESRREQGKLVLTARAVSSVTNVSISKATLRAPEIPAVPRVTSSTTVRKLEEMRVSQSDGKTTVTIRLDQAVKPVIRVLSDPKRFVMDFPETQFGADWKQSGTFNLSTGPVSSIRAARFKASPSVVRLVFDQAENAPKPDLVANDQTLTLVFENPNGSLPRREITQSETLVSSSSSLASPAYSSTEQITKQAHAPFVSYDRGMLFVDADNSNLPDILYAISQKTGAQIELPMAEGMLDRVGTRIGPASPRDVIAKLLDGSIYNYIIVENEAGKLDEVLLSPKQSAETPSN